jgi:hypothetical protein
MFEKNKFLVSISAEVPNLFNNKLFILDIAKNYPGSAWAFRLNQILNSSEFLCVTADVAFKSLTEQSLDPKNILVIQHNTDFYSQKLIELGAHPFLLIILESPLYAPKFFNSLKFLEKKFFSSMIFCSKSKENINRSAVRFPSFFENDLTLKNPIAWHERKFSCMVLGNKYVPLHKLKESKNLHDVLKIMRTTFKGLFQKKYGINLKSLANIQLQDKRYEAVIYFVYNNAMDLYGRGWNTSRLSPPKYRLKLREVIGNNVIKSPSDKISTLMSYQFNFCYENISYPGYVTEKIFDALLAGTIPVYWGAPDIEDFIPSDVFINASKFSSNNELLAYMKRINVSEAEKMIARGKEFLNSKEGRSYSYEKNAEFIADKIKQFTSTLKT